MLSIEHVFFSSILKFFLSRNLRNSKFYCWIFKIIYSKIHYPFEINILNKNKIKEKSFKYIFFTKAI